MTKQNKLQKIAITLTGLAALVGCASQKTIIAPTPKPKVEIVSLEGRAEFIKDGAGYKTEVQPGRAIFKYNK